MRFYSWAMGPGAADRAWLQGLMDRGEPFNQDTLNQAALKIKGFAEGTYDPDLIEQMFPGEKIHADTNKLTGQVTYGRPAFRDASRLIATGIHEGVHVSQFLNGSYVWDRTETVILNKPILEMEAARFTIQSAGRLGLSPSTVSEEVWFYNKYAKIGGFPEWK